MRLTTELITKSLEYRNALGERELNLRGHKIPTIENLGVAKDEESIDLTDNDIQILTGFPQSPRLLTLLLARNRIASISPSLSNSLPNLFTLVLTENNLSELADLDPLQGFKRLTSVSLVGNPVVNREHYRHYLLWRCPQIRFLDFKKVKDAERERGRELFGEFENPTALAQSIAAVRSRGAGAFAAGANGTDRIAAAHKHRLTAKEVKLIKAKISSAKTAAEMDLYEKALETGRLPPGLQVDDSMDET